MAPGVYYNENDKKAAAWLRNLIALGAIAGGDVDERSIVDVKADDLKGYAHVHFFAGIGGWAYALDLAGWPRDREVWTGSCPCQPFSAAGKAEGLGDERHLWPALYRLITERHPPKVFGEQVASKDGRHWLSGVRVDLERVEYAVGAADLCAAGVGAPNIRQRSYWVANATDTDGRAGERGAEEGTRARRVGRRGSGERSHEGEAQRLADSAGSRRDRRQDAGTDIRHAGISEAEKRRRAPGVLEPERGSAARGFADTDGGEPRDRHLQSSGEHGLQPEGRRALRVGDALESGLERHRRHVGDRDQSGRVGALASRPVAAPSLLGFWSEFDVLPFTDSRARRVEPGSFPLAHGIPADMGRGRSRVERMAIRAARAFRTTAIRGYGNAINPELAADFIMATA